MIRKRVQLAQSLRKQTVPAEALLWKVLRNRGLGGYKFRRQHPIGPYVVDFACVSCGLVVELDGETHLPQKSGDVRRSEFLEAEGWRVLRFWNTEVYDELEAVKEAIFQACAQKPTDQQPGT
jgi:very-short-patch-repair endonuclease